MEANVQSDLLSAVISKFIAEKDDALFRINAILADKYDYEIDQAEELKQQFSRIAKAKLEIQQVQFIYAELFPPQTQTPKTEENGSPS